MADVVVVPPHDILVEPGAGALLYFTGTGHDRLLRLSAPAYHAYQILRAGGAVSGLAAELERTFGAAPGGTEAQVSRLIDELVSQGAARWLEEPSA